MRGADCAVIPMVKDGNVTLFIIAEHWNAEDLGWHVAKHGNRYAAAEALALAVKQVFGFHGRTALQAIANSSPVPSSKPSRPDRQGGAQLSASRLRGTHIGQKFRYNCHICRLGDIDKENNTLSSVHDQNEMHPTCQSKTCNKRHSFTHIPEVSRLSRRIRRHE
jgi:hypothetical protein